MFYGIIGVNRKIFPFLILDADIGRLLDQGAIGLPVDIGLNIGLTAHSTYYRRSWGHRYPSTACHQDNAVWALLCNYILISLTHSSISSRKSNGISRQESSNGSPSFSISYLSHRVIKPSIIEVRTGSHSLRICNSLS